MKTSILLKFLIVPLVAADQDALHTHQKKRVGGERGKVSKQRCEGVEHCSYFLLYICV